VVAEVEDLTSNATTAKEAVTCPVNALSLAAVVVADTVNAKANEVSQVWCPRALESLPMPR